MADPAGTADDPWTLTTPSGGSEYQMYRDEDRDPPLGVVRVHGSSAVPAGSAISPP